MWGKQILWEKLELAFELMEVAERNCCDSCSSLSRIDLFQLDTPSAGKSQIVMIFEERAEEGKSVSHTLRLTKEEYLQQLANYCALRTHLRKEKKMSAANLAIDLRLHDLAFIAIE